MKIINRAFKTFAHKKSKLVKFKVQMQRKLVSQENYLTAEEKRKLAEITTKENSQMIYLKNTKFIR
jgi:hypothetical protein